LKKQSKKSCIETNYQKLQVLGGHPYTLNQKI